MKAKLTRLAYGVIAITGTALDNDVLNELAELERKAALYDENKELIELGKAVTVLMQNGYTLDSDDVCHFTVDEIVDCYTEFWRGVE